MGTDSFSGFAACCGVRAAELERQTSDRWHGGSVVHQIRDRLRCRGMHAEGDAPTVHAIAHSFARVIADDHLRIAEQWQRRVSGRTWDRNERDADRRDVTEVDLSRLLQGLLVDADGRPISLSTTHFHSVVGQIRDKLAGLEAVRELMLAVLRELMGR